MKKYFFRGLFLAVFTIIVSSSFSINNFVYAAGKDKDKVDCSKLTEGVFNKDRSVIKKCSDKAEVREGTLEVWHYDYDHKKSETKYFLNNGNDSKEIQPVGDVSKNFISGKKLKVKGHNIGKSFVFDASDPTVMDFAGSANLAPGVVVNPDTQGDQKTLVLLANFQDTPQPVLTKATVDDLVFNQMNNFYVENSYGKMSLSGDSFGWYQLTLPNTCNTSNFIQAAVNAADPDVNFANYSRLVLYAPFDINNCGWAGISSVGKGTVITADGTISMSKSIINSSFQDLATLAHEYGHGLGVQHSQSIDCGGSIITLNKNGCSIFEYGDPFDVMGYNFGHLDAPHKEDLGWFDQVNIQNVTTDGTYTIYPIESPSTGLQAIKIQRATDGQGKGMLAYQGEDENGNKVLLFPQSLNSSTVNIANSITANNLQDPKSYLKTSLTNAGIRDLTYQLNSSGDFLNGQKGIIYKSGSYDIPIRQMNGRLYIMDPNTNAPAKNAPEGFSNEAELYNYIHN